MAAQSTLASLPPALVAQRILALLPVDARARAATVCRGWRDALADARLWTRLDLSDTSGVTCRVNDGALRAAAARAGGALQALDLRRAGEPFDRAAVLQVVQANAGTLRELRAEHSAIFNNDTLTPLLRATPELRVLSADISCSLDQAPTLLRNEPPYGPLRLYTLRLLPLAHGHDNAGQDEALVLALAAALPAHASLRSLEFCLTHLESDAACGALVDALLAVRLTLLGLWGCHTTPATASALARLLSGNMLTELRLHTCLGLLDEAPSVARLAAALRANTTLTTLSLADLSLWTRVPLPGAVLLGALTGHPSLKRLTHRRNHVFGPVAAAAGDALGVLVAANAHALTELDISHCRMLDEALGPLCDALPRNTHLRILDVSDNPLSAAFAAERLLPAVRANASLRQLRAIGYLHSPALGEAMALVSARATTEVTAAAED